MPIQQNLLFQTFYKLLHYTFFWKCLHCFMFYRLTLQYRHFHYNYINV